MGFCFADGIELAHCFNYAGRTRILLEQVMQKVLRVRHVVVSLLGILTAGCMHPAHLAGEGVSFVQDIRLIDNHTVNRPHRFVLPAARSIYVAESLPSATGHSVSGLARQTASALAEFFPRVRTGDSAESLETALRSARKQGADYLFYPQTVIRDDDVGSWSDLVSWLRRRDPVVQGVAPETAAGTAAIRARQLDEQAAAQAEQNREEYLAWRDRNADSPAEQAAVQALRAQNKRRLMKDRLLGGTRDAMQWVHERTRASVNWVRGRDLDALGRDQVGVRLTLVESRSGEIVETAMLRGQSGVLTFFGDQPEELVDGPMRAYAQALSGQRGGETYAFQRIPF